MTPILLQKALAEEIEKICSHIMLKNSDGKESKLKAFMQNIPLNKKEEDIMPYVIVKLSDGETEPEYDPYYQIANLELLVGTHDEEYEAQGQKDVMNIINDIMERFLTNPLLDNTYIADRNIIWTLQTNDIAATFPKYYGGMLMKFKIPKFTDEGSLYT